MRAEGLEHGEGERDQRHQREQRRVYQPHRIQVYLAAGEIAQDGVGIAQQPQRQCARSGAFGELAEQVSVEPVPEREDHRGSQGYGMLPRMSAKYPERIVCLTEETTETLYLLGE